MTFLFGGGDSHTSAQKLSGMSIQSSSQGLPIPIVFGQTRLTCNILWYGDFVATEHTEDVGGGKNFGPDVTSTTYTYTAGLILGLCEGPIAGVGKIWASKDKVTLTSLGFTAFLGTSDQAAWGYMTTNHPEEAYAYRGTAYLANAAFNLGNNAALPNLSFEVSGAGVLIFDDPIKVGINNLNGVAHGNGKFVVVTSNGSAGISTDAKSWTAHNIDASSSWSIFGGTTTTPGANWKSVSFGNNIFVAVGATPKAARSADGSKWYTSTVASGKQFVDIAFGNNIFCAVSSNSDCSATAANGASWAAGNLPFSNASAVAHDGVSFCTLKSSGNSCATAADGITWTSRALPATGNWVDIAGGNGIFVAITHNSNVAAYSNDHGATWAESDLPVGAKAISIGWNGIWFMVTTGDGLALYFTSDGVVWSLYSPSNACTFTDASSVAADDAGNFVAIGVAAHNRSGLLVHAASAGSLATTDVNPRDVIFPLLGDPNYGAGFPADKYTTFDAFAAYCDAQGLFVSPAYTSQTAAADMLTELALIGNSALVWSEGVLKIIPFSDEG